MKIGGQQWLTEEEIITRIMRMRKCSREEAELILDMYKEDHPEGLMEEPDA